MVGVHGISPKPSEGIVIIECVGDYSAAGIEDLIAELHDALAVMRR